MFLKSSDVMTPFIDMTCKDLVGSDQLQDYYILCKKLATSTS